jgi:hypothetical protein
MNVDDWFHISKSFYCLVNCNPSLHGYNTGTIMLMDCKRQTV